MADVSIVRCASYDADECRAALEAAIAAVGGLDWVQDGMKIAVKVNLVSAMRPEEAATVHPVLLTELVKLLRSRGASVVLGDSPGGLYTAAHLNHVYDVTGLRACEAAGAQLNQNFAQAQGENPAARQARHFQYTAWLDDADAIIDFCKLKTHGQMGMTCAVKNFFGTIPGTMKPEYHYKYPKIEDFADMIVDLCEYFKPRLYLCDAVVGMEGNGPTQGTPRAIGAVLAAGSAHALDLAAARILGFEPREVPTLAAAIDRGLCPASADALDISGALDDFVQRDVKKTPAQSDAAFYLSGGGLIAGAVDKMLHRILTPFPQLHAAECIHCGKCAGICPAKAITMTDGLPRIDRRVCIHCFCCQEFCPKGAMRVGRTWIARTLNK